MHPLVNIGVTAARKAGNLIMRYSDRIDTVKISEKTQNDFVTEVDKASEQEIIEVIHKAYPDHKIIGEESGESDHASDTVWIIDPLDGTKNFIHNFPHFAVSIACQIKNKIEHAIIYDPVRQELFTATRGQGAYLNDRQRLRVSSEKRFDYSLIGTGFPFRHNHNAKIYMDIFQQILPQTSDIRRAGAAALDLAYVAAGRLDGFWEFNLKIWDIAAGILLIKEAGGLVSDTDGSETYLQTGNVVTGNPKIFKALLQAIQPNLQDA